jgi:hypothetical protein
MESLGRRSEEVDGSVLLERVPIRLKIRTAHGAPARSARAGAPAGCGSLFRNGIPPVSKK